MKSFVQLIAALMFVLASAGMVPASEHAHVDAEAIHGACGTDDIDIGHFLDAEHNTGVHCGSPVLMAHAISAVETTQTPSRYDRPTNDLGDSFSLRSSLPPPRSLS